MFEGLPLPLARRFGQIKSMTLERSIGTITEEQAAVATVARQFAAARLAPRAAERDRTGAYPLEEMGALGELGLLAMKVPGSEGGGGTDNVGYVLAMEAIAEACASTAVILASSNLVAKLLSDFGTPAQKARWLRPYTQGRLGAAAFALSEPGCGSDAAALTTTARKDGESWILDGAKMWITSGAHAGFHLVFARSDGPGPGGISCFIVDRGTPGLTIGKEEDKMGQRASGTVALHFDRCRLPAENLLSERGHGYAVALGALGAGRVGIAALSIGLAEAAFGYGLAYAQERKAFGKAVADFQNTQFVLADCRTELDAAWLLSLRAARLLDTGDKAAAESSMAKLFATEASSRIIDKMLQVHGGYGYSRDYPIERLYRDSRVTRIYEGSSEIQRMVIARDLLGKR